MKINYGALTLKDLPQPPLGKVGWPWTKTSKLTSRYMADGSEWPRISVVTPSYNQGQFLEETIRSVLLQGYPNLEYIIIDGCSTDNSVKIIKKYQSYVSYWVSETDKGQAHAINKGLRVSTGPILGWVNSDDLYEQNALKKVAQALQYKKSCVLVHGNRILLNENSEVTGFSPLLPFEPKTNSYNISSETAFWRRDAMDQVGLFKESLQFAMDLEFFGRLYLHGQFLKLDDYLGYFRCYSQNKSSTIAHVGLEEAFEEWKNLFGTQFVADKGKPNKATLLKGLILNPITVGLPYLSYKISKYASKFY